MPRRTPQRTSTRSKAKPRDEPPQETTNLLTFIQLHARKRLCIEEDGGESGLLERLISGAVGSSDDEAAATTTSQLSAASTQPPPSKKSLLPDLENLGPSATAQLLALLVAAIARPEVVHADEAAADESSDDEEVLLLRGPDDDAPPPPARKPRNKTTNFTSSDLSEELRAKAREPQALLAAVRELLTAGADANARDADANSPLYLALHISCGRTALAVVHDLLKKGADPNTRRHGASVCHHALTLGRAPLVQRLLREGAYPQRSGSRDEPPRRLDTFAEAHGFGEEAMQLMRRALRTAAAHDDARAAQGLLAHGCPPENKLLYALVRKRRAPGIIHALLRAGGDPNHADDLGTHLLTLAVMQENVPLTRTLLAARADPLIEEDGQSILSLARGQGAAELVALMERGATIHDAEEPDEEEEED